MQSKPLSESDVFNRFTTTFESFLQAQLRKQGLEVTQSIDQNISLLGQTNAQALKGVLLAACDNTIGQSIPESRLGDHIYAFILFVIKHRRTPKDQLIFNDVIYKIKTTDEILDPLRIFVSDKEFVKIYVKAKVGDQYNVPTIDVIRNVDDVDDYEFPSDCCIKPTHLSSAVFLRRNNEQIDRIKIKSWFSINYYKFVREANYKTLKPKLIIEPLIFNKFNVEDYKFFCYNGAVKLIQVDVDRYIDHRRMLFDTSWNDLDFSLAYPKSDKPFHKPDNLEEMIDIATKLSSNFGFVRVDLYSDGINCLVGEITNCPGAATERFVPVSGERSASNIIFH